MINVFDFTVKEPVTIVGRKFIIIGVGVVEYEPNDDILLKIFNENPCAEFTVTGHEIIFNENYYTLTFEKLDITVSRSASNLTFYYKILKSPNPLDGDHFKLRKFDNIKNIIIEAETKYRDNPDLANEEYKRKVHEHIDDVQVNMNSITDILKNRSVVHDESKFSEDEMSVLAKYNSLSGKYVYNNSEDKIIRQLIKPALDHHYKTNRHHPEHFNSGDNNINNMNMFDILEMLADWKSASSRNKDGGFIKSLISNYERFKIPHNTFTMMLNTCIELGWITERDKFNIASITISEN